MNSISSILKNKTFRVIHKDKQLRLFYKPNYYFKAKDFSDYLGIKLSFVFKLFKKYGAEKVLSLRSFLKDYPIDKRGLNGIIVWKLNQTPTKAIAPLGNRNTSGI